MNLQYSLECFNNYLKNFDAKEPSIRLKIIHTYKVVELSECLGLKLGWNDKDICLAKLIALLHDIGRFPQFEKYQTFVDYQCEDHAMMAVDLLFNQGMINEYTTNQEYQKIIYDAIINHNKYKIEENIDEKSLKFVHLIRDVDKLDNYRIKEIESFEVLLNKTEEELEKEVISESVKEAIMNEELVLSKTRKTKLDFYMSWMAFVFDLHYDESVKYINDNDFIIRCASRLKPKDKDYDVLIDKILEYVKRRANG